LVSTYLYERVEKSEEANNRWQTKNTISDGVKKTAAACSTKLNSGRIALGRRQRWQRKEKDK